MADDVLTGLAGREGGSSRPADDDLVEGGCGDCSLVSGSSSRSSSGLGDFGFGFAFAPPIFLGPLEGFCWAFCGGGEGDFLPRGCSSLGFFAGWGSCLRGCCCLNLGGVS